MDWQALNISLSLAALSALILTPVGVIAARYLAWKQTRGRSVTQALIALPLVLPPTVLGLFLLLAFSDYLATGLLFAKLGGQPLVFSFEGILAASLIFNIPFIVQPMQRGFETIPRSLREAAWCSGLSAWQTFWKVELPLAWPGVAAAIVLTMAHTMGEFGVVLMVGGNLAGETRTLSIAIYDQTQALDIRGAALMSALLVMSSFAATILIYTLTGRLERRSAR